MLETAQAVVNSQSTLMRTVELWTEKAYKQTKKAKTPPRRHEKSQNHTCL